MACVTIDSLVERGQISGDVKLIKIDVEGAECGVIRGAKKLLAACRPVLIVEALNETLRHHGESVASLRTLIQSSGYSVEPVGETDWLCLPA